MNIQTLNLAGQRFVVLPEVEYERLCGRAGEAVQLSEDDLPPFPKPDRKGRFLAEEYTRVSLARDIIRERRAKGLTQSQLAKLAGIRQETLSRIEAAKQKPSAGTVDAITKALAK